MPPATSRTRPTGHQAPAAERPADSQPDGRHARRDRNKIAVVEAYLDLIREGMTRPGVAEVAERSGISHRSVFRYFADKDDMARTSIQLQHARIAPLLKQKIDPSAPLEQRVDQFIEVRLRLYETIAPSARLARSIASSRPVIQTQLNGARAELRANVKRVFGPELAQLPGPRAADVLASLDVITSFEAVELLRQDQALSKVRLNRVLRHSILTLLGGRIG